MSIVHVTNDNDSGAGSFRAAVSGAGVAGRRIVFDFGGDISIDSQLYIDGHHITVAGESAPAPGITFSGHTIYPRDGAHDIVLRGFRFRDGWDGTGGSQQDADGITITRGVYNVVCQYLSLAGAYDENLDIWDSCHDVSVIDCMFGPGSDPTHNFHLLIGKQSDRVSVARNVLYGHEYRAPAGGYDDVGSLVAPGIVVDVVGNLIVTPVSGGYGPTVYHHGKGNVVGNYIDADNPGEISSSGLGYFADNHVVAGSVPASNGGPFAVDTYAILPTLEAVAAGRYALAHAGCRVGGLDATDTAIVAAIGAI